MFRKKYTEPLIHIAVWLFLYVIAVVFIKTIGPFRQIDGTLIMPVTVGTIINAAIFYSVALWLIPRYAVKKEMRKFWTGLLVIFIGSNFLETFIDFFFLVYVFSTEEETFLSQLLTNSFIHFIIISLALGYGFTKNWIVNEKKRQDLAREKLSAELNFLKTQLSPHFLFNVLNMAYSSASRTGDERTADIIEKLSGLMRYIIYESNVEKIDVDKEIEYIRNYIRLQKMRFSKDIPVKINFEINGNYTGLKIAPLILIPFIENAFKYGVKLEKESKIDIILTFQNEELEFIARNPVFKNAQVMKDGNSGIGIKNTRKRLEIMYPGNHKLSINENGGFFTVKLMLKLNNENTLHSYR